MGIGRRLIGRNIPTTFQPLKVIYGDADEPRAKKYKFGWTIIGPVCLDKIALHEPTSEASVNCVTVRREELPVHNSGNVFTSQTSHPTRQRYIVTHFLGKTQMRDITSPNRLVR